MAHGTAGSLRLWGTPLTLPPPTYIDALTRAIYNRAIVPAPLRACLQTGGSGALEISVLGASVSAGCGAASPSAVCAPANSHSHHLYERLRRFMNGSRPVHVSIWAKNAVQLNYFTMCPGRFQLSPTTTIVLIEAEPAMAFHLRGETYSRGQAKQLSNLVQDLRRVAPHAAFGFLGWSIFANNLTNVVRAEAAFAQYVQQLDPTIELAFASSLLTEQAAAHASSFQSAVSDVHSFYADGVHPSRVGHALLGALGARLVADALMLQRGHGGGRKASSCPVGSSATQQQPALASKPRAVQKVVQKEWCYLSADDIPVVEPLEAGIALHDEGGATQVKKLGFVSHREGATLTIGPVAPTVQCGLFETSVGYLQSWRPKQGSFQVRCVGCDCVGMPSAWDKSNFQYPRVRTTIPKSLNGNGRGIHDMANTTLTIFTKFMLFKSEAPCFINLTHVPTGDATNGRSEDRTRIRIDAFGLQLASCYSTCALTMRPYTKHFGMQSRIRCLSGAQAGRPGYMIPRCFEQSSLCRVAARGPTYSTY